MNDLLVLAVDAHGGLDRWNAFTRLRAEVSIDGAIWRVKQQPGLLIDKVFEVSTHKQHVTVSPFPTPDERSVFVPERIVFETLDSVAVETRENPEASFIGQQFQDP
jgi:hypothetical protein